jgi:iron-sulfur cluster repair protein YtfE (RIC family)
MPNPIKRVEALKPLSRDHHHGLLLCWKIRQGFKKNVEVSRIKKYCDWFWKTHLENHFEIEEKHLFPILPGDNEHIVKVLAEHRRLKRLFETKDELAKNLSHIEEELELHIRFEERILFNLIQEQASQEQLQTIEAIHCIKFEDNLIDPFWEL